LMKLKFFIYFVSRGLKNLKSTYDHYHTM
jgi:hypothetical protein